MKFLTQLIVTIVVCYLLQLFLPWWTLTLGSLAIAFLADNKGFVSFVAGFLAIALLWIGMAYYLDFGTNAILSEKINRLLPINAFVATMVVGGLVGGFAALTGALLRSKKKISRY